MGASNHSSRILEHALFNASRGLPRSRLRHTPPVQIQTDTEPTSNLRSFAIQLGIINAQQEVLRAKDYRILDLHSRISRLRDKITRFENQCRQRRATNTSHFKTRIKNSESVREERLLRNRTEQKGLECSILMNEHYSNSESDDPPDLSPSVYPPILRRATRRSRTVSDNSRIIAIASSSSYDPDDREISNNFSSSLSPSAAEKLSKSSFDTNHRISNTVERRLRNQSPKRPSKLCIVSPKLSALVKPFKNEAGKYGTGRRRSKTNHIGEVSSNSSNSEGSMSPRHSPDLCVHISKPIVLVSSTSTGTSPNCKRNNKIHQRASYNNMGYSENTSDSDTTIIRTTRTRSSDPISAIRQKLASVVVKERPSSRSVQEEEKTLDEATTWSSPLILNESENCLTTRIHYHTLERSEDFDNEYKSLELLPAGDGSLIVEVPSWREKLITKSNYSSGVENLEDNVFLKRHQKLELDERRRKRWDAQRLREEQYLTKLKSRLIRRRGQAKIHKRRMGSWGRNEIEDDGFDNFSEIETFEPKLSEATCIRVEDDLPISAFGCPIPIVEKAVFELPWELKPRRPKRSRNEVYYKSSFGSRHNISGISR